MFEAELAIIRDYVDSLPSPNATMTEVEFLKASMARWAANEIETRVVGEIQFVEAFYPNVTADYVPQTPYELVCWYIFDLEYLMHIRKVPSVTITFEIAHETACNILHKLNEYKISSQK